MGYGSFPVVSGGGGSGTVTSVAQSVPSFLAVSGSPITTSGTLAITLATQAANLVFAGPTSGGVATPTFRALVAADLPALALTSAHILVGNGSNVAVDVAVSGDISISNAGVTAIASGVIVNADVNASAAIDFSKLATLSSANILVGSAGNVATSVAVTGDVTLSNAGVTAIASGVIVNADINASAAIDFSKLATLTSGNVLVGSVGNVATSVAVSGDISLSNAGVTAISSGVIVNADINASAAIDFSKFATLSSGNILVGSAGNVATSVAVSGDLTITNAGVTAIGANKVTLAQMATMATASFLGRTTASTGNVEVLSATQATAILNVFGPDSGSGGVKGLVPATVAGDSAKFLKGNGTWATPSASAALTTGQVGYGIASVLGGSAALTFDTTEFSIKIYDSTSSSNLVGLRLQNSTTGTTSSDGFIVKIDDIGNVAIINYEPNKFFQFYNNGTSNRFLSNYSVDGTTSIGNADSFPLIVTSASVSIGSSVTPSSSQFLLIQGGTTTKSQIKLTSGTLTTTAQAGAIEYNGTHYISKASNIRMGLGGVLTENFADAGNTTTSETDLYSYTTPASTFDTNGQSIEAWYGGIFVNSTSTKQVKIYFGGTAIFDSTALVTSAASSWDISALLVRVSSTVVRATVSMTSTGVGTLAAAQYTEVTGLTLTNTNILKITGTAAGAGAATNDIVAKLAIVKFNGN